jgi:predicted DNA-binding protein
MTITTIRLNEAEADLFNSYAELQGRPLSTLLKEALREQIEDFLDLKAGISALHNRSEITIPLAQMISEHESE